MSAFHTSIHHEIVPRGISHGDTLVVHVVEDALLGGRDVHGHAVLHLQTQNQAFQMVSLHLHSCYLQVSLVVSSEPSPSVPL